MNIQKNERVLIPIYICVCVCVCVTRICFSMDMDKIIVMHFIWPPLSGASMLYLLFLERTEKELLIALSCHVSSGIIISLDGNVLHFLAITIFLIGLVLLLWLRQDGVCLRDFINEKKVNIYLLHNGILLILLNLNQDLDLQSFKELSMGLLGLSLQIVLIDLFLNDNEKKGKGVPPQGLAGSESQKPDNEKKKKDKDKKAHSPLDQFSIVPFYPIQIGKFYFSLTNASFFLLVTLSFVLFSFHLVTKKGGGKSVPNAFQSVLELIYDFVPNLVNEQIGGLSGNVKQPFFPCISVTFTFSLFRNLQGMIPYSFTVTSHFIVTLGLSFSLFIGITIVGFVHNGLHFLSFSLPAGVPLPLAPFLVLLELIPHCFRALSLGIRLFANMMAGHSLVKILSGFAWTMLCMNDLFYFIGSTGPFFIVLALTGLELGVAILQAYVFTILICIYLNDAINLH